MFRLRFDEEEIEEWAALYNVADDAEVEAIGTEARKRGYYTHEELLTMGRWTTTRTQKLLASNDPVHVERHTQTALSTYNEERRMEALTSLKGVSYPTATLMLHFGFENSYPIFNPPSLWSLGYDEMPAYTLELWLEYIEFCRDLAARRNVTLRTLTRALKQFANEHQ